MPLVVIIVGMTALGHVTSEGMKRCNLPVTKFCTLRDGMLRKFTRQNGSQPPVALKDTLGKQVQDGHDIVARCCRHLVDCRCNMIFHIVLGSSPTTR